MEQPKFKAAPEIKYLDEAYATTLKFVAQLKIDKKNPMYMHAKMVLDDKSFKKDIKKAIKKDKLAAEEAVEKIAEQYSQMYAEKGGDMMSEGATFDGDALAKEITALKKKDKPSNKKPIIVGTYLSNVLKPIDAGNSMVVNTNKLFLEKEPTVNEQVKVYKKVLEQNKEFPVAFVLLNVDAIDQPKWLEKVTKDYGRNSLLIKGIRLGYINQPLIMNQIKAIIKASHFSKKPITIVLPMVSTNEEYLILQNTIKSMIKKEKTSGDVRVSVLLETPSMVMEPEVVLSNSDELFLDIDSLTQYTLGIEKDNHLFAHLNQPLNSSVLRQIRNIILQAKKYKKKVWILGKSVNEPEVLTALIGLGAKHIIVSRYNVEETEKLIDLLDVDATYELVANNAQNKVAGDTQKAIEEYLDTVE